MSAIKKTVTVEGESIPYTVEHKEVKRINLRVRPDGSVHLSVPRRTPLAQAEQFVIQHAAWIARARARMHAKVTPLVGFFQGEQILWRGEVHTLCLACGKKRGVLHDEGARTLTLTLPDPTDPAACEQVFLAFVKSEAARILTARTRELYPLFAPHPPTFPAVKVRWMRARWGSCHHKRGQITLSTRLMFLPLALVDFVILHELCHFTHPNHSADFHRLLARFVPDEGAVRRALSAFPIPRLPRDE